LVYSQKKQVIAPNTQSGGVKPQVNPNVADQRPVRFAAGNTVVYGATGDMKFAQRYNTNSIAVSISGSSITIKKAGLYHFEGMYAVSVFGANAAALPEITFALAVGSDHYAVAKKKLIPSKDLDKTNAYQFSELYSIELYIPAGTVITLKKNISASFAINSNIMTEGWFSGYLVSE
jgi:hypothetical protein